MATTPKRYSKILFQKGQADLVSAPFYVGDNRVALSAFANGAGLPPGARITFQEVVFVDGGRSDGTLCSPGQQHDSKQYDYKPFVSCGCEPALTERLSYMEIDRAGWYRAVYVGPSRSSVMLTVMELGVQAGTGCCSKACCPIEVDLTIDKSISSETIVSGDTGFFTIVMSNLGPDSSRGGSLVDALPAGLTYGIPSAAYAGGAQGSQPALAQLANGDWHYTVIPPGGSITLTIPFTATSPGSCIPKSNTASIHPGKDELDTNWVNNTDTVFYAIIKPAADVSITKDIADSSLKEGDPFTYTLVVSNSGPRAADGTSVTDAIPEGLVVSSIVATYTGGATGTQPTQAQLAAGFPITALPAGGSVTIVISGIAPTAGYYLNSAFIKMPAAVDDTDPTNNTDSAPLTVIGRTVDLSVVKTSDKTSYAIGEPVIYHVAFANAGPDDANGAIIEDILPASLSGITIAAIFSGGAAAPVPTAATLAGGWTIPTFPSGGAGVLTITGIATSAGVLTNAVSINPPLGRTDTNPSNNNDLVVITIREDAYQTCNGDLSTEDTIFTVGSLRKCVDGEIVPLECGDVVKILPAGCEPDCEITTLVTSNTSLSGGGVCIEATPGSYQEGTAIAQMRDFANVRGSINFTPGNPPTHFGYTYTNNTGCPALFEATLTGNTNAVGLYGFSGTVGGAYGITDQLNVSLPTSHSGYQNGVFGYYPEFMRHTFKVLGVTAPIDTGAAYHEETVSGARYKKILAIGETITVYAQAWLMFFQDDPIPNGIIVHTNMQVDVKVTKGAAYL